MALNILFTIYMSFLAFFGALFNLTILLVYRKNYLSCASIYLVFALAFVDFLISIIAIPFTTIAYAIEVNNRIYCGMLFFLLYFFNTMSVLLLALISYERYNTISAKTMTKLRILQNKLTYNSKRATVIVVCVCFLFSVWSFYFYDNEKMNNEKINNTAISKLNSPRDCLSGETYYYNLICCISLGIIIVLMIIMYLKSYMIVYKSTAKIFIKNLDNRNLNSNINIGFFRNMFNKFAKTIVIDNRSQSFTTNSREDRITSTSSSISKSNQREDSSTIFNSNDKASYSNLRTNNQNNLNHFNINPRLSVIQENTQLENELSKNFSLDNRDKFSNTNNNQFKNINEIENIKNEEKQADEINFNPELLETYYYDENKNRDEALKSSQKTIVKIYYVKPKYGNLSQSHTIILDKIQNIDKINEFKANNVDLNKNMDQKSIFVKRPSNCSVLPVTIRKDWKVARMFFLVSEKN